MWNEANPDDLPPSYTAVRQHSISYSDTDASAALPPAPAAASAPASAPAPTPAPAPGPAVDPSGYVNVWTGLIGLIADSLQTGNDIIDLNFAPDGATAPLDGARTATSSFKLTIQLFYKYLRHIEQGRLERPARAALVELDIVITLLTDAIVALAGLGALLQNMADVPPPSEAGASSEDTRRLHVETLCANHATAIRDFCRRILVLEKLMSKTLSALRV
jgi:hypothetical protein